MEEGQREMGTRVSSGKRCKVRGVMEGLKQWHYQCLS